MRMPSFRSSTWPETSPGSLRMREAKKALLAALAAGAEIGVARSGAA